MSVFLRGKTMTGFGYKGTYHPVTIKCPVDTKPFVEVNEEVFPSQALVYRLTGDFNPIHADPMIAMAVGFERPILHGLCTYGLVAKHIVETILATSKTW